MSLCVVLGVPQNDLPTGIPIDDWWTWQTQRFTLICGGFFWLFFAGAAWRVRSRDFTL